MLQKSGRLVLWEAMFILELHSAETQGFIAQQSSLQSKNRGRITTSASLTVSLYSSCSSFMTDAAPFTVPADFSAVSCMQDSCFHQSLQFME